MAPVMPQASIIAKTVTIMGSYLALRLEAVEFQPVGRSRELSTESIWGRIEETGR